MPRFGKTDGSVVPRSGENRIPHTSLPCEASDFIPLAQPARQRWVVVEPAWLHAVPHDHHAVVRDVQVDVAGAASAATGDSRGGATAASTEVTSTTCNIGFTTSRSITY